MASSLLRRLAGPGLLFTGASIGTSHLVQSTRAGAMFGAAMIGVIVLVNVLKYPAFRFGVDFTHARHRSLLTGYRELGTWALVLFLLAVLPLIPIIWVALAVGTAGIVSAVFGAFATVPVLAGLVLVAAAALLLLGGYRALDKVNAWLLGFLVLATLVTTVTVLPRVEWGTVGDFSWTTQIAALMFIAALAGFMPSPVDLSAIVSLWKVEADHALSPEDKPPLGEVHKAFFWPYVVCAFMAVCFCVMGAGVMHAQQIAPVNDAPGFAAQLVNLYREALGDGVAMLAAVAALSVMATTVISAMDGYIRVISASTSLLRGSHDENYSRRSYALVCLALLALSGLALFTLLGEFTVFLDFVTTATFITAPLIALLNHLVVTRCDMPEESRPSAGIRALSLVGVVVMTVLAVGYFVLRMA